jgi:hypothetical protein
MVTKQLSIAIAISICIGSGIGFKTFAAAPPSATRIDFDQVFYNQILTNTHILQIQNRGCPPMFHEDNTGHEYQNSDQKTKHCPPPCNSHAGDEERKAPAHNAITMA